MEQTSVSKRAKWKKFCTKLLHFVLFRFCDLWAAFGPQTRSAGMIFWYDAVEAYQILKNATSCSYFLLFKASRDLQEVVKNLAFTPFILSYQDAYNSCTHAGFRLQEHAYDVIFKNSNNVIPPDL